jgi:hypothetical protein
MEERDPSALTTAKQMVLEYSSSFNDIQSTFHPAGIPGESAGKSSNVAWAAQEVMAKYRGDTDVLVTVMDSERPHNHAATALMYTGDSHLMQQYFDYVRIRHLETRQGQPTTNLTLYVPPIVFDRNAHTVPLLVRAADLMWSGAGLSCYGKSSRDTHLAIPTSVYTLSLPLVQLASGWDTGADAIGEDMHMMLKCYFATKGLLKIESIPSPVSVTNIDVSLRGIRGYLAHHKARYVQALRHMWGCLDSGYAVKQWLEMRTTQLSYATPETSPVRSSNTSRPRKLSQSEGPLKWQQPFQPARFTIRNTTLFLRMLEAHVLPIHLPLVLLASALYTALPSPTDEWLWLRSVLDLTGWFRAAGFVLMILYFTFVYEAYHATCIQVREAEMRKAGLHESVAFSRRRRWRPRTFLDYAVFPIAGTLYGAVPLLQAAIMHFWTTDLVYLVSSKPAKAPGPVARADLIESRAQEDQSV